MEVIAKRPTSSCHCMSSLIPGRRTPVSRCDACLLLTLLLLSRVRDAAESTYHASTKNATFDAKRLIGLQECGVQKA